MRIIAEHIWTGGRLHGRSALHHDGAQITAIEPHPGGGQADVHLALPLLTDLQVNGGGGVMLNSDPTPEGMRAIAAAHRGLGTGGILPTVITDTPEVMQAAAEAALACHGQDGILGLHIEGPHINPARKGTHDARHIRPLDEATLAVLRRLRAADVPVLLTLAPELAAPAMMRQIRDLGVVISAGHSAATAAEAAAGMANGVSMFTHLFNAMPPMLSRDPGIVGAAILSDGYCGFIADGIHVSWEALRIAIAARPRPDRMFIVSDAMATVGGPDHFTLYGQDIAVRDGALVNAAGSLAGAHIDMRTSLHNLHRFAGLPLAQIIPMATEIPRAAMGLPAAPEPASGTALRDLLWLDAAFEIVAL